MPNLLFDYDGTLHDSMKIYAPSVQLAWDRLAAKGLTEPRTLSEEELRRRGFRLVLLSNCPVSYLEAHTEQFHLEQYFEGLYCAEEFGYRPKYEIFERLRGHYPGPFAVVGDRRHDMEAAQRGGVPAIGCLYGYGSPEELAPAAYLAYAPSDLPRLAALFAERCGE